MAINFSGTSLNEDKFLDFVLAELARFDPVPGAICFEITETAAISNLQRVAHFMSEVKKRGCEFSLDDFGSGFCSFAQLKNLPTNQVKIDGQFVKSMARGATDRAIVTAMNDVAHSLGRYTVAEYV